MQIDPTPMEIMEARQVSPDELLLKWRPPNSPLVTGYEIDIDGVLKSRVHSIDRTSAIVHGLTFDDDVVIDLYAVSKNGRCLPPAKSRFIVCNCQSK